MQVCGAGEGAGECVEQGRVRVSVWSRGGCG